MASTKIRKWDEIKGMPIEGYEQRINVDEVAEGDSVICRNPLKTVEEQVEQNCNYIDGVINNVAPEDYGTVRKKMLELAILQFQRNRKERKKEYSHYCVLERELI